MENVKWGEYVLEELFTSSNGDFDIQKSHINGRGDYVITAGSTNNGILGKTDISAKVFEPKTITVDMFGFAFYRYFNYKMVTHARVFSLKPKFIISDRQGLFFANSFHFFNKKFGYENMCSWEKIKNDKIWLPTKKGQIDFDFMELFVSELEAYHIAELESHRVAELNAYLLVTGLNDYNLTKEEEKSLKYFDTLTWKKYNIESLFGKSTRGKRLKNADRIKGNLPFITACEGVSAYIGNEVETFNSNTITIDMFGSAKYRNFCYGADDHVAVIHTEKLSKNAAIFVTTSVHKSSYTGKFDYSRNFYAKDADELDIFLPTKNNEPNYSIMSTIISAIQKLVIKDVVICTNRKINMTKLVVKKRIMKD